MFKLDSKLVKFGLFFKKVMPALLFLVKIQ